MPSHSLLELPQNLWPYRIAYFLDKVEDLVRLDTAIMNTCSRQIFLKNMSGCKRFSNFTNNNQPGKVRWFVLRKILVADVEISSELHPTDANHIQQFMSSARSLCLVNDSILESKQVSLATLLSATSLLELSLVDCEISDLKAISQCERLTSLKLQNCNGLSAESFAEAIPNMFQLKTCHLLNCTRLETGAVVTLLQRCTRLTALHLDGYFDMDKVLAQVNAELNLESFACKAPSYCILTSSLTHQIAKSMPCLQTLHLQYPPSTITDDDIEILVKGCPLIINLLLCSHPLLTNAALMTIAQQLPKLQHVHIDGCDGFRSKGIITLAQSATNIHTLSLHNQHISDDAIKAVGTHCRALQHLDVSHCSRLTDDAFSTLNVICLETLNISGTQVRGSFVKHVCTADSIMHTLECLKCTNLCSSFVPTAMCCEKLHTLRIGSAKFSKHDLLQLGARFPNVRHLVITDVRELHCDIAHIFYTHHQALHTADLTGCPVSRGYETLSSFRETFPHFVQ